MRVEPPPQQSSAHCSASGDLERLNDLLDEVGGDIQQQNLAQWFEQLGEERDRKLDAYCPHYRDDRTGGNAEGRMQQLHEQLLVMRTRQGY